MKQPELGKVIQQQRLSKGMTQEELVERCNINVRTIQRIEAGEVTPRAFTVKTIMEVLDIQLPTDDPEKPRPTAKPTFSTIDQRQLWWAGIAGVIYFLVSSYEVFWNIVLMADAGVEQPEYFTLLKTVVLISYAAFAYGFYLVGQRTGNKVLQFGVVFLILVNAGIIGTDIYSGKVVGAEDVWFGVFEVMAFGVSLIPFSIGLILSKKTFGQHYQVIGGVGLLTGLIFITWVFKVIGLLTWAVFDIACIYLLFKHSQGKETVRDGF
ncbi:helix-turn-helix domain-containing protein [Echinicola strongylocentroti]|nr:helix-turn-helix transcriptional regulator [Echinicola strongylocentroti]